MRKAPDISDEQPDRGSGGKHRRPTGPIRVRRRWLVVAAVAAAFTGLVAPPPGPGGSQVADAASREKVSAGEAVTRLTFGAPVGAITLASAPARVASPQPIAPDVITGLAANGIPNVALNAYRVAAARMGTASPSCGIDWSLIAGIGRVESNHGRFGGAVLHSDGTSTPRIIGPSLNGIQFAFIRDTDRGLWDGDPVQDRAVGPMQFIPATWRAYAINADGVGSPDPFNINDAALAAAHYLCVAGGDLRTLDGQRAAVMAYNHSDSYVSEVLSLAHAYATGIPVADLPLVGNTTGAVPAASGFYGTTYASAPASPGPAIGATDMTPASGPTTGQTSRGSSAPSGSGGSTARGTSTRAPGGQPPAKGSTPGGSGSVTNPGTSAGSGAGGAPAPAPARKPAPAPVPAPLPVPALVPAAPTMPKAPVSTVPPIKTPPLPPAPTVAPTCGVPLLPAC